MTPTRLPKKNGRPRLDLSFRFKAALWALRVKLSLQRSWDELDRDLLDGVNDGITSSDPITGARLRVMHRIFRRGDDPTKVRVGTNGAEKNLVEKAAREYAVCEAAKVEYGSPLWALLVEPERHQRLALESELTSALTRLGLTRIDGGLGVTGLILRGSAFPYRANDLALVQSGISRVVQKGNLDAILVLAVSCRLAMDQLKFDQARLYATALHPTTEALYETIGDSFLATGIQSMTTRRILFRDWSPIDPLVWSRANLLRGPERSQFPLRGADITRQWEVMHEINPYLVPWPSDEIGWPLVAASEHLKWLADNRKILERPFRVAARKELKLEAEQSPETFNAEEREALRKLESLWPDQPAPKDPDPDPL